MTLVSATVKPKTTVTASTNSVTVVAGADVTEQINGVTIGTIVSGGTNNQVITDSAASPVGTEANPSVIGDATVTVNGDSLGATGLVVAEGSVDLVVNLDGSPSGYWDGDSWEVTSAVCLDATVNINGVFMENIPSGDTENIEVRQETGATLVGSKQGQYWRVDDSTVENSDASYSASVVAEGSLVLPNITVTDSDGTTSSVPSVQDIVCTPSTPLPTLTIGVFSDVGLANPITEADYLDTIYISLTTSITTPTEYRFFVSGRDEFSAVQAGSTLAYTINGISDLTIYAEAIDGSSIAASKPAKTITVINTVSNAFIASHETETGVSMDAYQKGIVANAYKIANGIGSTNNTDLLDLFRGTPAVLFPYVPTSDSVASADAYKIDFLDPTNFCTFTNFIPGDFLPSGLAGGGGKSSDLGVAPSAFGQNSISFSAITLGGSYVGNGDCISTTGTICRITKNYNGTTITSRYFANDGTDIRDTALNIDNVITVCRTARYCFDFYIDGVKGTSTAYFSSRATSETPSTANFNGHVGDTDPMGGFHVSGGLDDKQAEDLAFLLKYIKDNIITGGR